LIRLENILAPAPFRGEEIWNENDGDERTPSGLTANAKAPER
jgi:hypothetical protein